MGIPVLESPGMGGAINSGIGRFCWIFKLTSDLRPFMLIDKDFLTEAPATSKHSRDDMKCAPR